MDFIDLKSQYATIEKNIQNRINKVLSHGKYIMGPEVYELEEKLAELTGTKHCITCGSGTDALLMSLMSLNIAPGDEVITTAFSFYATIETIMLLGAKPIFVDIDADTFNIKTSLIASKITENTKAILPVSLFGQCADIDEINIIAKKYNLPVVEDGAQSFGALYKNRRSCNLSTIGCTSFFPSKPLGCYGDGGACFTNDDDIAEKLRSMRSHGMGKDKYNNIRIGLNSRLDTIQAAVLLEKLTIFQNEISARQSIAEYYDNNLSGFLKTPKTEKNNSCVWALYSLADKNRNEYLKRLRKFSIPYNIYYEKPLYSQKAYLDLYPDNIPSLMNTQLVCNNIFSIPIHPYLNKHQLELITSALVS